MTTFNSRTFFVGPRLSSVSSVVHELDLFRRSGVDHGGGHVQHSRARAARTGSPYTAEAGPTTKRGCRDDAARGGARGGTESLPFLAGERAARNRAASGQRLSQSGKRDRTGTGQDRADLLRLAPHLPHFQE